MMMACLLGADWARAVDYTDAVGAETQTRQVQLLRRAAWRNNDYLAQFALGETYANQSASEYDPVEAYVWYFLASTNLAIQGTSNPAAFRYDDTLDDAANGRRSMFSRLSAVERAEGANRITYILACRGAVGLMRLGEFYDPEVGEFGRGARSGNGNSRFDRYIGLRQERGRGQADRGALPSNATEALLFYSLAEDMGHPYAQTAKANLNDYLNDISPSTAADILARAEENATSWLPPFEIYANGKYSDECPESNHREHALRRVYHLRPKDIQHALKSLGYYHGHVDNEFGSETRHAIEAFQRHYFGFPTGHLLPRELAALIRLCAASGDSHCLTTLGYMYACGIGVVGDEYEALRQYKLAYRQRNPLAAYNISLIKRKEDTTHKCAPKKHKIRKAPDDDHEAARYLRDAKHWGFDHAKHHEAKRLDRPSKPWH